MMTSVEIARRATRHLSIKDPSEMDPGQKMELLDAINSGLNRYFRYADDVYKKTTVTELLLAPVSRTVTIAEDATETTGAPFTLAERGKAIVIPDDEQFNEIVATNQILRPYKGTTGSGGVTSTIYSDAVAIRDFAVERLASHPRIIETNTRLAALGSSSDSNQYGDPWNRDIGTWYKNTVSRNIGNPTVYGVSYVGGSREGGADDAVMIVHLDPIPSIKMTIEFDIIIKAANLGITALSTPTALPIHESVSPDLFQRLIEAELTSSSMWAADNRITNRIESREEQAIAEIKGLTREFSVPSRTEGTAEGW